MEHLEDKIEWKWFVMQTKPKVLSKELKYLLGQAASLPIDLCHSAAMLSPRRIKSFVFARLASPRRKFSARLAVQKQSFLFSWDSTWPPSDKGL